MKDINKQEINNTNISRRVFCSLIGATPFIGKSLFADETTENKAVNGILKDDIIRTDSLQLENNTDCFTEKALNDESIILPPAINEGDTVAFTAPASPVTLSGIATYIKFFKSKGCKILVGDTIKNQKNEFRYFSATTEDRANELNTMFADTNIKAIICGRGGYGVMRILPFLDYDILRKNPKIIMGYSDITALHLAIYRNSRLVSYYGPVGSSKCYDTHKKNISNVLFDNSQSINYNIPEMQTIFKGTTQGKLQGGNLTLISTTLGTPYEIDLKDSIFFVEDVSVLPHEIDRMMTQLTISEKFSECKGVIIGKTKGFEKRGRFHPNKTFTMLEIFEQLLKPFNIPCVYNLPFGHVESHLILPYGVTATLDTEKKRLNIER